MTNENTNIHETAKAYLLYNGYRLIDVHSGKDVIIPFYSDDYTEKVSKPVVEVGTFDSGAYNYVTISFSELTDLGMLVIAQRVKNNWFKNQKVKYEIVPYRYARRLGKPLTGIPENHEVQYDKTNGEVRLVGRNASSSGKGEWVRVDAEL